tara:strand:+ start:2625 stop:2951 length:327 start_codon:yes stop_codon:yes gene_type:complete
MKRNRTSSKQTVAVLSSLLNSYPEWGYGYELSKQAQLKSGSLYPILMRLSDRNFLESTWEDSPAAGRPPRHMYRLSASGLSFAKEQIAASGKSGVTADMSYTPAGNQA